MVKPCKLADKLNKHFQSVYNNPYPNVFLALLLSSEFSSLAPISDLDVFKALKRLKPSISVAVNDTTAFVIKGWSDIFVPFLKHIFNQRLSQKYFPTLQKQEEIMYFKKRQQRLC